MSTKRYVPSGRLPLRAVLLTVVCAVLSIGPAWAYAWLTVNVPLVIVSVFALTGFACCIGLAVYGAARRGRARNPLWIGRLGMLVGIVGWYAQWAACMAMVMPGNSVAGPGNRFAGLLGDPQQVAELAWALSGTGVHSVMGITLDRGVLIAFWLVELLVLVAVPRLCARHVAGQPFCESAQTWAAAWEAPRKFAYIASPTEVADRLEHQPEQVLSILEAHGDHDPAQYAALTLYRTSTDSFLTVTNVQVQHDGKNERKRQREVIVHLRLAGMDIDRFIEACRAPAQDAGAPQSAMNPPELEAPIEHLASGHFEEALAGAIVYVTATQDSLRIDALRLCALAASRLGRWDASVSYWTQLFGEEPSALNALQVGTSCAMAGDAGEGMAWIARARELNAVSHDTPELQIITNFITALVQSGQTTQALPFLDEVRSVYVSLGITDPTFLFLRQIPRFDMFLENSLPVIEAALDKDAGRAWYAAMLDHLDESGQQALATWLNRHFSAAPSPAPAAI